MPDFQYGTKVRVVAIHPNSPRAYKDRFGQTGTVVKVGRFEPAVDVHFDAEGDSFSTQVFHSDELEIIHE